jgi:undecaprenyl-diphosphatase
MDFLISALLGVVEGLTEFLPVSSTAHLRIVQQLFHLPLNDPFWKMYAIVIQLGAILCLPVYFFDRLMKFVRTFPKGETGDRSTINHPLSLVMIAFVVTAIPAFLLKKKISANLENLTVMGAALLIGGAIMWAVDTIFGPSRAKANLEDLASVTTPLDAMKRTVEHPVTEYEANPILGRKTARVEEMSLLQAIWIGFIQIFSAVFPGTSRSMATIAAAQTAGMTRPAALEFSFFLSIPTMTVATLWDLLKTVRGKDTTGLAPSAMTGHQWLVLLVGFIVSFIVALGVVAWFMSWVRRRGFAPFAIYRIIVGLAVLIWARSL